jgi:hypothetical protein
MDAQIDLRQVIIGFLALAGFGFVLALVLLAYVVWRVKRIRLPVDADFLTTLRATPFVVVVLLDLLDFSLDFLSAPFAWVLLGYLGLEKLRGVTVIESLLPGTQVLPTMTLAWIAARLIKTERLPDFFRQ